MLTRKIQCQVAIVTIRPPSGGPNIGPASPGIDMNAIALISSDLSTVRRMISRATGVIIAPPMPCRMRAATKVGSEFDRAQQIDPVMNTTIARRKILRAPKRSAIQPLTGMKIASASR